MFCPECGKNNADELEKCAYCGAALEDNSTGAIPVGTYAKKGLDWIKNTALPFVLKYKKIGIPIAVIVVLLIGFYAVGSVFSDPQRIVSQYVDGVKNEDWNSVYNLLDLEENDFISVDHFITYCETNTNNYSDITSYNITEQMPERTNEELIKSYIISYVTSGATYENSFELKLVKQEHKSWLFYPTYKISTQNMLGECSILTYPNSNVSIDGTEITSNHTDDNGYAIYTVSSVFQGEHTLKISHELFEDYEDTLYISDSPETVNVDSLRLKEGVSAEISSLTQSNFKLMCEGAIAGKEFKNLGISYTKDDDKLERLIEQYENFSERIKREDGTGLKNITLSNFSDKSTQSSMNRSMTYCSYMNFDYTYTYTYKSGDEVKEESSQHERDGYISITYSYENDGWVMSSIDNYSIYY